jgi:chromosomal replication initiator protein
MEDIAQRFQTNIRELEGAMTRLMAYADLRGMVLDEKLVDFALADLMPEPREIEPGQILSTIAQEYGVTMDELLSHSRSQRVAFPRQVAMYILREESELSLPKIGELLGGRDHTTIMYGHEKITDLLERDKNLRRKIVNIQEILYSPVGIPV